MSALEDNRDPEWWRKYGNPEDFPIGTRVVTKKCAVDMRFFAAGHVGMVVKNEMRYLSVIVEFDRPIHKFQEDEPTGLTRFNFHPENLIRLASVEAVRTAAKAARVYSGGKVTLDADTFDELLEAAHAFADEVGEDTRRRSSTCSPACAVGRSLSPIAATTSSASTWMSGST